MVVLVLKRRIDTEWQSFHHSTQKDYTLKASAEHLSFFLPLRLGQQNVMSSKNMAKRSEHHTANVWGRMVALRRCWRGNNRPILDGPAFAQHHLELWEIILSVCTSDLLCDYLLMYGLNLLIINDLDYISNQNKNNKIALQSLVSSVFLYTYCYSILEDHQI